jgi:transposase InsO family protein
MKEKLKTMFATHGTPRQLESDNGPPFQSKDFAEFAEEEGFHHHRVTPGHARANGEAESFMKLLNKTEKIANLQGQKSTIAI